MPRILSEHEYEHRQIAERMRKIKIQQVIVLQFIINSAKHVPHLLLVFSLGNVDRLYFCSQIHIVKHALKPHILHFGHSVKFSSFAVEIPILFFRCLGSKNQNAVIFCPFLRLQPFKRCLLNEPCRLRSFISAYLIKPGAKHRYKYFSRLSHLLYFLLISNNALSSIP